jgi:rRNA processing protein Gar1
MANFPYSRVVNMEGKLDIISVRADEVLVRLGNCLKMDAKVVDNSGRVLGKIVRIMGPVSQPYGLIKLRGSVELEGNLFIKC